MHHLRHLHSWAHHRVTKAGSRDSGALSLELAVIFPVVLSLIFLVITVCFWFHARNVALSAAQRGVDTARVQGAALDQGLTVTNDFLDRAGHSITGRSVSGSDGDTVRIDVSGRVETWIPGLSLSIHQHASAARERLARLP
ncbi:pilus assembly protein [Kitasatospora sp. GP82]|uniref:TadE family protein n=1 Tax=Kitasatospora sp. GP82 TaxID=3035089 RepID=UPI002472F6B4|nr:pilus assembly protein [Kitasatospora sp. GP82]MDH6130509.1 Flp pilus assembly protein TadG [Kitasatospora sp. GP82]